MDYTTRFQNELRRMEALRAVAIALAHRRLGARWITGVGSTWSPLNSGCGLYLEPAGERTHDESDSDHKKRRPGSSQLCGYSRAQTQAERGPRQDFRGGHQL